MAKKTASNGKSKRNTSKKNTKVIDEKALNKKREIQALIIIALGIFLAIAMFFDITGVVGNALETVFKGCFGLIGYILPVYFLVYGALMLVGRLKVLRPLSAVFFVILILDLCLFNSVRFTTAKAIVDPLSDITSYYASGTELASGGIVGMFAALLLVKVIGKAGVYILAAVIALISIIIIRDKPYKDMAKWDQEAEARAEKRKQKREDKKLRALEKERKAQVMKPAKEEKQLTVDDIKKEEPVRQTPDYSHARKAINKSKLQQNQKNILGLMTDEDLVFGNGETAYDSGYGLDGSQKSLIQEPSPDDKVLDLDRNYDEKVYDGIKVDWNPFAESEKDKASDVVKTEKKEEKITNTEARKAKLDKKDFNKTEKPVTYKYPPINLLKKIKSKSVDMDDLNSKRRVLEETLQSFNVDARVIDVVPGPTVTRYEIQPNAGVKVNSIVRLQDDIALNLRAKSIRIEAPIPGKAAVGIEVQNDSVNMVTIREIIESDEFKKASSKISFAVGKDISGRAIVGDLKGMPHLLIAGSTGSGKSVCVNSIITSILYKADPDEVKLVLIDPKVVELGNYNGIPHLLIPVVTDPSKAAAALNWAVAEMDDRYKKFAESGVRDLKSYNEHIMANDEEDEKPLPQIVIIIDELADLMMTAPSQVEESICRIAQKARAAGMHLIVATQRPSVDVITGVIKANIPSRIAFAVSSNADSRVILDMGGAEKLVGKGDMLYAPLGMGKPVRVQGCFISDDEVNGVIDFVRSQTENTEYAEDVINHIERTDSPASSSSADDGDELLPECIEFVVGAGQASVSMLQRRFRIGYNRAARIMDMMEERGIVGPQDGSRPRQVLMSQDEFYGPEEVTVEEES